MPCPGTAPCQRQSPFHPITHQRENTYDTHPVNAGCSSFKKKPLYLTDGLPCTFFPTTTQCSLLILGGVSVQKYHGLTPICSLTS